MSSQNFTKTQHRILALLTDYPTTTFNQRTIAKKIGVSPTAIANSLPTLKAYDLITVENTYPLRIRLSSGKEEEKRVENFKKVYSSGLFAYLKERCPGTTIVLFGSYSRGEDTERSDIDIAIIGTNNVDLSLDRFEKLLSRKISVQYFSTWRISEPLKESIINGIVLHGHVRL